MTGPQGVLSFIVRTYLYVDGENFAIRARKREEQLAQATDERVRLQALLGISNPEYYMTVDAKSVEWIPEPHRSVRADGDFTRGGIFHIHDHAYWDALGLGLACQIGLGDRQLSVERAHYFASATGNDGITSLQTQLHRLGFTPHVAQRVAPDSFAKTQLAAGLTVVSRPKPLDIALATQVLEDAAADNFDRCVFVGGDEDYVPLLEAVRRRGKLVWLVAFEGFLRADSPLRLACDRFLAYDPVLALRPWPSKPKPQANVDC